MRRLEDPHLITGAGRYAGDVAPPGLAHVAFLRSPLAHARILSVEVAEALAMPGVLAIWTVADLPETARVMKDFVPRHVQGHGRTVLADGVCRYVGDAIAAVIAEQPYQAADAAAAIFADLEPLPAAGTLEAALREGAPPVWEGMESNVAGTSGHRYGEVEAAFGGDSVVVSARLTAARICGGAMEPRAVTAAFDAEAGGLTVWTSTQTVFGVRDRVADMLGLDREAVAVRAEDVGGGFGPKATVYPEDVVVALAAQRLQRPVRWVATRSEDTATTVHAHGTVMELELAAGPDGRLRGLRGTLTHDGGAYTTSGAAQPDIIIPHMVSAYVLPAFGVEYRVVCTNTASTGFVRGGGRPLGNFAIERLMDRLALRLGIGPVEVRSRNLIQPGQMPYDTGFPAGRATHVYDGGDYPELLRTALEAIGYEAIDRRPQDGRLVGVGLACCVESSGFGRGEPARVRLDRDGTATVAVGSTPQGQGHLTAVTQVLADRLGWPVDRIRAIAGDTRASSPAEMTAGSRTAVQAGNATAQAATAMRRRLLEQAAEVLEADPADLLLEDAVISVRGTPSKAIPATQVIPEGGLEVEEAFTPNRPLAFSSGCHAAVVLVDPVTGSVEIQRYVIVHDTGRSINARIVEGQMHGGFAHGLGYALFEEAIYTGDGGFVSASFLDYSIPGAPEVGVPSVHRIETASDANPEGFKGAGESGTIPAVATLANAIEDALRQVKPDVLVGDLPITPNRIFDLLAN